MSETDKRRVRVALRHLGEGSTLEVAERCRLSTQHTLSCLKALQAEGRVSVQGRKWIEVPEPSLLVLVPPRISARSDQDCELTQTKLTPFTGIAIGVLAGVVTLIILMGLGVVRW